jgi:hypothetical protein
VTRSRSLVLNLALTAASLAVCAAVLELAARIAVGRRGRAGALNRPISRYHPVLGWDKPPAGDMRITREEYDINVQINSKGLRGPERDYAKPPGVFRVLILGDSYAEGYYAEEDQTARAVLESELNRRCPRFEVLNGGTAGYSTDQEYLFFENEGKRYSPDLVVVFLYYNDLYYNTSGVGTGGKPKPYFEEAGGSLVLRNVPVPRSDDDAARVGGLRPWRGSIALRLLGDRTQNASPGLNRGLAWLGLVEPVSNEPFREFWPYGLGHRSEVDDMWRRTALILKALKASVESGSGRLAVLYVPSRLEVSAEALALTEERYRMGLAKTRDRVATRLRRTCEALNIPLVDPREALRRAEESASRAYFPNDGHWNPTGNAIVARELLSLLPDAGPCPSR